MKRSMFEMALKAHDASELVALTPIEGAYYRGYYAAQEFTAKGYPIGDGVEMAVKATDDEGAGMIGVVVFTLGEFLVCNKLAITEELIRQIYQAGGAIPKDAK